MRSAFTSRKLLAAIICLLFISLFYFAKPISRNTAKLFRKPNKASISLGELTTPTNRVYLRRFGQTHDQPVIEKASLHHRDSIRVESGNEATLIFNTGDHIRVFEKTRLIIETFNGGSQTSKPVLITLLQGQVETVKSSGIKGSIYITKDADVRRSISSRTSATKIQKSFDPPSIQVDEQNDLRAKAQQELQSSKSESLTNIFQHDGSLKSEYIEGVLAAKSENLRRCQMMSARDRTNTSGRLVLNITVEPNGEIEAIRIHQDRLNNRQLSQCVVSALKNTEFHKFKGGPISLTYPVEFR